MKRKSQNLVNLRLVSFLLLGKIDFLLISNRMFIHLVAYSTQFKLRQPEKQKRDIFGWLVYIFPVFKVIVQFRLRKSRIFYDRHTFCLQKAILKFDINVSSMPSRNLITDKSCPLRYIYVFNKWNVKECTFLPVKINK